MKLKEFLEILSNYNAELDVEFDVKSVESCVDFGRLTHVYEDNTTIVLQIK